jgi:predicted nucleotidyltransferase
MPATSFVWQAQNSSLALVVLSPARPVFERRSWNAALGATPAGSSNDFLSIDVGRTAPASLLLLGDADWRSSVAARAILELAARHGMRNVRVFGSLARGDARANSDVDLLVDVESGRTLLDVIGLEQDLEELPDVRSTY